MRILLIDKNLVDPINQEKWNLLASKDGVALKGITPVTWIENFRTLRFAPDPSAKFPIVSYPTIWPGYENRAFYTKGLGREMKVFNPEILVVFEEPFSLFALQVIVLRKLLAPRAKLLFYTYDNLTRGKHYGYRPSFVYAGILRLAIKHSDMILCANEEANTSLSSIGGTARKLYFGLDLKRYDNAGGRECCADMPFSEDSFVIGYVGRLLEMKGIDTIIRALKKLDERVKLVILGSGPDEARLKRLVSETGVNPRVKFSASLPSVEVPTFMRKMDVLVLPSLTTTIWKEQYGRVLVEAMASGVPVIGSDSGAIPEVIGSAGMVFHEGDHLALAGAIDKLRTNQDLRSRLAEAGRQRSKEFTAETFANKIYEIIEGLYCPVERIR